MWDGVQTWGDIKDWTGMTAEQASSSYDNFWKLREMLKDQNSEYYMSFKEKATLNGFDFEEFEVQTEDGYLLSVFRIRKPNLPKGAPVVCF